MNPLLNLSLVMVGPLLVVTTVAIVRWIPNRDMTLLGSRLRRWGFWAAIGSYALLAGVMALSMAVEGYSYPLETAILTVALAVGLPLGTWVWQRLGGVGLPVAMWLAVAALVSLAVAVMANPPAWWDLQNGGYPLASVTALAIGATLAVWGRRTPVPGGTALLVAGIVPLSLWLVASATAAEVLAEMFLPMPMFAMLGVLYLVAARVEQRKAEQAPTMTS